jgi:type VI protein secretion system component VasF
MWPIELNWKRAHVTVDNTRIVLAKLEYDRWGVLIFDPENVLHQLPTMDTEEQAEKIFHDCVKAIHTAQQS